MINVKNLFDAVDSGDGQRIWVEPVGLCKDLRQWCRVDHVLPHIAPSANLAAWFEEHPDGYSQFRGQYHAFLAASPYCSALQELAAASVKEDYTLVHYGDDPAQNSATALYEFLSELAAYVDADREPD